MAAVAPATGGAETLLLERTSDGGRKILISGGGRCNVLPARVDESRFVTDSSPHSLRNILRSWPLHEQIRFFEDDLGIPLKEEPESAKLFPVSDRARDVRDGLLAMARARGVEIRMNAAVTGLTPRDGRWAIAGPEEKQPEVDAVIIATGGLSVPKTGSDGTGLSIVAGLGHTIHQTYPALTPLTVDPAPFGELAGVSLPVTITATSDERKATATGGFLFTHRGYSGPSVLDVSHVLVRAADAGAAARIMVNWGSHETEEWETRLRSEGTRVLRSAVRELLPDRLAQALITGAKCDPGLYLAHLKRDDRLRLVATLVRSELPWSGHAGYQKAEVTGGGVSLAEIDPRTMQSRKLPGLFLCGEILDAFGPIGGYNFLWAWATGRAAGSGAARTVAR